LLLTTLLIFRTCKSLITPVCTLNIDQVVKVVMLQQAVTSRSYIELLIWTGLSFKYLGDPLTVACALNT